MPVMNVKDYADEQLSNHAGSRDHPDATLNEKDLPG